MKKSFKRKGEGGGKRRDTRVEGDKGDSHNQLVRLAAIQRYIKAQTELAEAQKAVADEGTEVKIISEEEAGARNDSEAPAHTSGSDDEEDDTVSGGERGFASTEEENACDHLATSADLRKVAVLLRKIESDIEDDKVSENEREYAFMILEECKVDLKRLLDEQRDAHITSIDTLLEETKGAVSLLQGCAKEQADFEANLGRELRKEYESMVRGLKIMLSELCEERYRHQMRSRQIRKKCVTLFTAAINEQRDLQRKCFQDIEALIEKARIAEAATPEENGFTNLKNDIAILKEEINVSLQHQMRYSLRF